MLVVHVLGALGLAGTTAAQALQIVTWPTYQSKATPVLYTCQASALAYTCDSGPCTVFIRPSDDPATILQSFASRETGSGSVTYTPGATASLTGDFIHTSDSTGNVASNAPTQVFSGLTGCRSHHQEYDSLTPSTVPLFITPCHRPIDSNNTSPPIRASAAGPSLRSTCTLRASVIITTLLLFVSH
ncbi:BZ3500_MvSof-1268-A1-R1_Chr3-1g05652 [Microbotryum saponariae]|uniref:BZ3500_MvSof-1268-A1-R1_Chr3-1g05652 protein n=1 Tax=Microbotryum saponariae TaxID=289078 RepID=A0A2X0L371_9BASI|nr:BZ3500_MvSof-1268-A1-R1_Chr3-1g05652 [Microbotryum saponariae]SDA04842.1 BZ3501_MvSof-1269-A2-R1_Chr3-1g05322 [Microbotryum saponariae]